METVRVGKATVDVEVIEKELHGETTLLESHRESE